MILIIFILGLVFGSFYNVVIYRLQNKQSIAYPPSACGSCDHPLGKLDLIPVLSYVFLKGKCRYCGEKVSIQYPIIEFVVGVIFVLSYLKFGLTLIFLKFVILSSIILIMTIIDYRYQIIPDKLSLFNLISGIVMYSIMRDIAITSVIYAFLLGGGVLFLIALVGPMGGGDIKIMAGFGVFLGLEKTLMAIMLSFILGGIIGVLLILFKIKGRKDPIPFGPFLGLGTLISFLYFQEIFVWYFTELL